MSESLLVMLDLTNATQENLSPCAVLFTCVCVCVHACVCVCVCVYVCVMHVHKCIHVLFM